MFNDFEPKKRPLTETELEHEDEHEPVATFEHKYHLRSDFAVQVVLPQDLTEDEANRLAKFVLTLPLW